MSEPAPVTDTPVKQAARAAAQRLAAEHGPGLEAQVEVALHAGGADRQPEQYFDPVSLGSLIVSVAALSWTVYKDLRGKTPKPVRHAVARRVQVELPASNQTPAAERDRVIEVVVEEIIKDTER
jgi:hypothetical protein